MLRCQHYIMVIIHINIARYEGFMYMIIYYTNDKGDINIIIIYLFIIFFFLNKNRYEKEC